MKVDISLMNRFFLRETTPQENDALARWIENDPAHRKEFDRAYDLFVLSQVLLGDKGTQIQRNASAPKKRRGWQWATAVTAVAAALVLGVIFGREHYSKPLLDTIENTSLVAETLPGLRSTVCLSDGTRVDLNSASRITYPAIFYGDTRRIRLEGEAMFDVTRDTAHPFIVETAFYDIKVLGTRFDVVADETRGQFSTALLEGSVEILDKQEQVVASLRPNQMVRLEGGRLVQSEMNNRDAYLWTNGIVSVTGVSFDEALKMLERAYGVNIEMRRSSVPEIHYAYLKFRISDGIEHALRILQRRCDFTYTYDEATGIYYIN